MPSTTCPERNIMLPSKHSTGNQVPVATNPCTQAVPLVIHDAQPTCLLDPRHLPADARDVRVLARSGQEISQLSQRMLMMRSPACIWSRHKLMLMMHSPLPAGLRMRAPLAFCPRHLPADAHERGPLACLGHDASQYPNMQMTS